MKSLFVALLLLSLVSALPAQDVPSNPDPFSTSTTSRYSREELKELVGPIALYPDPLVGLILPGSTFPSDIVLAARFVETGDDLSRVDEKPWDVSVRALTRYPDVLKWMDENLDWTTQLGHAYLAQPNDVMDAIQELRTKAQDVGNLVDTPQQRIVREEQYIRIVPAEPDYVYVPYYDPGVVYYERAVDYPLLTFGPRWLTGWWLCFDFDWHRHHLYCGDWDGGWDYHYDHDRYDYYGDRVYINERFTNYRVWEGDRDRRLASVRSLTDAGNRRRALAKPERFKERPQLTSKVEKSLAKREERWARRAVSSGLADNSVLDEKGRRGRDGRERTDTTQREGPNVSDALVGKGRTAAEEKGRADGVAGKGGKDRVTLPKGEVPSTAADGVAGTKTDKGRGMADAKDALEGKGARGKERIVTPKGDAPGVAGSTTDKERGTATAKGAQEGKGAGAKDRIVTPKSDAPSVAGSRPDKGKDKPRSGGPDIAGSSVGKDALPTRTTDAKGEGSGPITKPTAPPSSPQGRPKTSEGPSVAKGMGSPKPTMSPSVQQGAPKPKPAPSVSKSSSGRPSGPPLSVKQSSPKPRVSSSKPSSPSRPKVSASKPQGPSRPKVAASKPQGPSRPKVSASKPQAPSRPKVTSRPKPSKPSAPKGGGSNSPKKKKK